MLKLKPIKRTLRNAGFVLDDFATHIDKKELSFRHPYVYTGIAIAAIGVMIANKYYGFEIKKGFFIRSPFLFQTPCF